MKNVSTIEGTELKSLSVQETSPTAKHVHPLLNSQDPKFGRTKMRPILVFLILVLLVAVGILGWVYLAGRKPSDADIEKASGIVLEARKYAKKLEFANAVNKYDQALSFDDGNSEIYLGIADIYILKHRFTDAEEVLLSGLKGARDTSLINEYLGELSMRQGKYDASTAYFKKALSANSAQYRSSYLLGLSYVHLGKFDNARDVLAISEDGKEWYVRGALLSAVTYWDDTEKAKSLLREVLDDEVDPTLLSLVEVYVEDLERVETLEDDAPAVYRDVVLAHGALEAGYSSVVVDKLASYVDDEKNYWDLYLYLGRAAEMELAHEKAQEYLEQAVLLNPSDPYGAWFLARVCVELDKESEMRTMYERAVALSTIEERASIRKEYAINLLSSKQYEEFDQQLTALKSEDPDQSAAYDLLYVDSLVERDLVDDARMALDAMSQSELSEDEQAEYSWLKSRTLFLQGEREQAIEWALESVTEVTTDPRFYLLLGTLYFEDGDEDKSKYALERAIDLDLFGEVSAEAMKVLDRI